ncbi:OmpA family protein [Halomonas sp. McH1-25]|uniref:OmpA family protein n=1 Tax=unclassified Halomonas TaxID=2609666 RepID=UPI001EF4FA63|nr:MULTISPECIES: OmpA family protein [unclassified Halomonas]MCG7599629.1 OmpA family protein [Halomonas sp. McH1-25]MCP1342549.1 OmpA family protein [Halomonas sp. FL8]MCP1361401.1 OmpA family protein [Halomonas sp. BBD45]
MTKQFWLALPLATAVAMTGCTTTDPYSGETQRAKATTGAGIGAAVGAVAGALSGDGSSSRRDRAVIGAAVGAAAGSGIGYYMDRQEAQLRERLQGTGIGVERQGDNIVLNMPSSVTFGFDSSEITPEARQALNDAAAVMQQYPETRITIAGHTDSSGSDAYNQQLSERRAQSVGNYLMQNGVAAQRLTMVGYGESQPVASNANEQGRAQNRRVEITLTPMQQQIQQQQ